MDDEAKKDQVDETKEEDVETGGQGSDNGNGAEGDKGTDKNKQAEKTFTQAQVTRMMAREKGQGRTSAYNELGIDPKNAAQVAAVKAFIDSQKTDAEKAAEQKATEQTALNEAQQRAAIAEAKAEAMILGVQKQFVDDVVVLAMAKMASAGEGGDLKTIIGELKTKYPVWFSDSGEDEDGKDGKKKQGQKGTGSSIKSDKAKGNKDDANKGLGARLAAQRKGKTGDKKSSYWG